MKSMFLEDLELVIGAAKAGNGNLKLPFRISETTEKKDIDILILSPRSNNSLKRNHVDTIGQIVERFNDLGALRNIGTISVREIRRKTAEFLYEAMSVNNRKAFWREFLTLNNIEGLSATK